MVWTKEGKEARKATELVTSILKIQRIFRSCFGPVQGMDTTEGYRAWLSSKLCGPGGPEGNIKGA